MEESNICRLVMGYGINLSLQWIENILEKEENASYHHALFFILSFNPFPNDKF